MMIRRIVVLLLIFATMSAGSAPLRVTLRGTVSDAATGERLPAANIRIAGAPRGTISNEKGEYTLPVDSLPALVVVSFLGYQSDSLFLTDAAAAPHDFRLLPSPIRLPDVIVVAEDPAIDIIRQAIAHKREWMSRLKSYSFKAFSRQVLNRDSAIAGITESYSEGFQVTGDTLREVVKQRRQTENVPMADNFSAVRRIVNFNEDVISLFSLNVNSRTSDYRFTGPTAPDALGQYDYRLLRTTRMNGHDIYHIRMTPKSRLRPLFDGEIAIAEGTYAVVGVDVRPNETFTIPFIKDINLRYRQSFALYDSLFWMPADIRISGAFTVSIVGMSFPRIGIESLASIYDYSINPEIPDSILRKPRLVVDSSASTVDTLFWARNLMIPLTEREQAAYHSLDSTQTLEKQFEPKGPLSSLNGAGPESMLGLLDLRYNRVEGLFAGVRRDWDSLSNRVVLHTALGYGFSDQLGKYELGATLYADAKHHYGIGAEVYRRLEHVPDENYYGQLAISLMTLLDRNDYRDYYLSRGWGVTVTVHPVRFVEAEAAFTAEDHFTLDNQTEYSLFSRSGGFRPNPPVTEGKLRSLRLNLHLGEHGAPLGFVSARSLDWDVEYTAPGFAGSDFDFTRYQGALTWIFPTFSQSLLFPQTLRFRLSGGLGLGTLPPQRLFVPDTRSSGYAPFGVLRAAPEREFAGDRFVMLNVEHNFRSIPFLMLNIPWLYRNSIELLAHASCAQTWNRTQSNSGGWYSEAGIGLGRILDLFRLDCTYRMSGPPAVSVTASFTTLF